MREIGRRAALTCAASALVVGCARPEPGAACGGVSVWLLDRGWHTEIALATDAIEGPLAEFVPRFPGAVVLLFGFGKRSFMTAPARDLSELVLGPFPGDGLVQVIGLRVLPDALPEPAIGVELPAAGRRALADFIWSTVDRDAAGAPLLLGARRNDGSVFYVSTRRYGLDYTCNAWTAEALAAAGLAVSPDGVTLVRDVLAQVAKLPAACRVGGLRSS